MAWKGRPTRTADATTAVHDALRQQNATIATAESLTGGRLAAALTSVPGASEVYRGGVVAYATEVKIDVLGVPQRVVDEVGVVSADCATAMANGVRRLTGATYGVATTGVAGPGEQEGKPVGTVFVAVDGPAGSRVVALELTGDREQIVRRSCDAALEAVLSVITPPEERGLG